jgi:Transposase DDE domain
LLDAREQQELRAALQLPAVPDYTTLYRFLRRLEDHTVDRGLSEAVRRLRRRRRRAVSVAVDGTHNSVSAFFIRRREPPADCSPRHRHWLKWVNVVDVQQQILLAQRAHQGPGSDVRALPGLLDVGARGAPIALLLADAEFDSEPNHQHIRQRARSIIPAKRRGIPNGTMRNQMYRAFPERPYRQRSKIETVFSVVKRKRSSRAPGRSLALPIRQALLLGLTYNLYRLRHRPALRMSTEPSPLLKKQGRGVLCRLGMQRRLQPQASR